MTIVTLLLDLVAILIMLCAIKGSPPTKDYKRIIIAAVILIMTAVLEVGFSLGSNYVGFINEAIILSVIFCLAELPVKTFVLYYVISWFVDQLVVHFSLSVMEIVGPKGLSIETDSDLMGLLVQIFTIFIIAILSYVVIAIFKVKVDFRQIPKSIFFSVGLLFVAVIVFTLGTTLMPIIDKEKKFGNLFEVITIVVCVSVFIVAIEIIYLALKRRSLQDENKLLVQYNEQQQQYYELLLKKEEDTRRYRHDMLNHMICIDELLNQNDIEEAKKYILNITNDLNSARVNLYHTGNRIADVIMSSVLQNKSDDTKVTVTGQLKPELGISDHDLCIVLSNILKNAVEAVNKQQSGDKYIKVQYSVGKRFLRIEEYNSIDESQVYNAQNLETSKDDKRHHGLGTKNIRMIAKKYNGQMETSVKNNEFYLCVDIDTKEQKKKSE